MFNYSQSEIIINSLDASNDAYRSGITVPRVVATAGLLNILRSGMFEAEKVTDKRVYKTPGYRGNVGSLTYTVDPANYAANGVYRFSIFIGLDPAKYDSEYTYANWYKFGKPILVEIEKTSIDTDVTLAAKLAGAIKDAVPYNNIFAQVKATANVLTVTLTEQYAFIKGVRLDWYNPIGCDSCVGAYEPIAIPSGNLVITANKTPFATSAWMEENLRFPTILNRRYLASNKDEAIVPGALYTMYSFEYRAKRDIGGLSMVGQAGESITRHVFYVLSTLVASFDAFIETAFGAGSVIENYAATITSARTIANDGVAVNLTADLVPASSTATIAWSSANLPTDVTLTADGVLTAVSTAVVNSTFEVTATPSDAKYAPSTVTMTVIAG